MPPYGPVRRHNVVASENIHGALQRPLLEEDPAKRLYVIVAVMQKTGVVGSPSGHVPDLRDDRRARSFVCEPAPPLGHPGRLGG